MGSEPPANARWRSGLDPNIEETVTASAGSPVLFRRLLCQAWEGHDHLFSFHGWG